MCSYFMSEFDSFSKWAHGTIPQILGAEPMSSLSLSLARIYGNGLRSKNEKIAYGPLSSIASHDGEMQVLVHMQLKQSIDRSRPHKIGGCRVKDGTLLHDLQMGSAALSSTLSACILLAYS
jgi:hypothetical protein